MSISIFGNKMEICVVDIIYLIFGNIFNIFIVEILERG